MIRLDQHRSAAARSTVELLSRPVPTVLTTLVIGIALALPLVLWMIVVNLEQMGGEVRDGRQLSVFLNPEIDESAAMDVLVALQDHDGVSRVDLLSRDAALADLEEQAWVRDVVAALGDNPLPVTILVEPEDRWRDAAALASLAETIASRDDVDQVQLDAVWINRLDTLIALMRRVTLVIAALLALAVLLTITNTIRLMVVNRRDEIDVIHRIGGTDAFVRRPFLYSGLLQGLLGGALAVALVMGMGLALDDRVSALVAAYGSSFSLKWPGWVAALATVTTGVLLGVLAAWFAVSRHLARLRPR